MKIGRNAPCPCGSGKKYKKCCLDRKAAPSQALHHRRLQEAYSRLAERLADHASRTFGEKAVNVAMDEFLLWPDAADEIDEALLERLTPLFWPWFLFNWEYSAIDAAVALSGPEDRTVAELYAEAHAETLDPFERRLIAHINRKPYSFWEVLRVDEGLGLQLENILVGGRIGVHEDAGSEFVEPGDLLFGRAVSVDGVGMTIGLCSVSLPPSYKPEVIRLRKGLRRGRSAVTNDTLYEWDVEIREVYLDFDRSMHSRPELVNTDGDLLERHRLVYEVSSADEAFEKLTDLCATLTPAQLRTDAEQDESGRIRRVEMTWDRREDEAGTAMPNIILGRIVIDGQRLIAEVNSAERAEILRQEIEKRLGDGCRFKFDEIQDMDAMLDLSEDELADLETSGEHGELIERPEVLAQVRKMLANHWEGWVDEKLPALGGQSPREAVQAADGREAVEALLLDIEKGQGADPVTAELNRNGAQRAREMLGLPPR